MKMMQSIFGVFWSFLAVCIGMVMELFNFLEAEKT